MPQTTEFQLVRIQDANSKNFALGYLDRCDPSITLLFVPQTKPKSKFFQLADTVGVFVFSENKLYKGRQDPKLQPAIKRSKEENSGKVGGFDNVEKNTLNLLSLAKFVPVGYTPATALGKKSGEIYSAIKEIADRTKELNPEEIPKLLQSDYIIQR